MSTADKLITVAENVPKVYHAGQLNVIENTSTLKKSASGSAFLLDDVSPVTHDMAIKISSDTVADLTAVKVSRCGKNLFDINQVETTTKLTNNGDGTLTVIDYGMGDTLLKTICPALKVGETYTLTFTTTGVALIYLAGTGADIGWYLGKSLTITEAMLNSTVLFYCKRVNGVNSEAVISDIQIELGSTATDYEPYITPTEYTPTADGTVNGVTSLYPNISLMTDTEGVLIDCEYYKDIDVDEVVTKTIMMYTNPKIKTVGKYAFYNCSALKIIDIPIATNIGNNAFQNCTSLTTVNLPSVTSIESHAFYGCSVLKTLYAPAVIKISSRAFEYCTSLTTANFPVVTNIEMYAFQNCTSLITANFPLLTSINAYAFSNCTSLTTINFPVATTIVSYAFSYCSTLKTVNFPAVTAMGPYAFEHCTLLTTVDFPILTTLGANVFKSCATLTSVILRSNTVCTLSNTNAFTGCTKITGTGGYIYVPSSLIDTYKTATNWVTYASKFRALEDYTVDGTTTGALDESKVST